MLKAGSGTVILSSSSSYTGGATLSAGVLVLANSAALPTSSMLWIGPDGTLLLGADDPGDGGGGGQSLALPAGSRAVPVATGTLNVNSVPEPGTMALLGVAVLCGAACGWAERRD